MTPLYRALTRLDAAALREIAACEDEPLNDRGTIAGAKPHPAAVARIALPLLDCYEGRSGDPQALLRAVEQYARRSGAQVYLDADDAARLTVPGLREVYHGVVAPVLPGSYGHSDLRDFLNFYPWSLRALPAVESMAAWVRS